MEVCGSGLSVVMLCGYGFKNDNDTIYAGGSRIEDGITVSCKMELLPLLVLVLGLFALGIENEYLWICDKSRGECKAI